MFLNCFSPKIVLPFSVKQELLPQCFCSSLIPCQKPKNKFATILEQSFRRELHSTAHCAVLVVWVLDSSATGHLGDRTFRWWWSQILCEKTFPEYLKGLEYKGCVVVSWLVWCWRPYVLRVFVRLRRTKWFVVQSSCLQWAFCLSVGLNMFTTCRFTFALICLDAVFQRIKPNLSSGLTVSVVVRFVNPKPEAKL